MHKTKSVTSPHENSLEFESRATGKLKTETPVFFLKTQNSNCCCFSSTRAKKPQVRTIRGQPARCRHKTKLFPLAPEDLAKVYHSRSVSLRNLSFIFTLHFTLCILHFQLFSQHPLLIHPHETYSNPTPDTLFLLPKQTLETLMEQEEISNEMIKTLEFRSKLCDSTMQIKSREAESWYLRLMETDKLLQEAEIKTLEQKKKNRIYKKLWFGAGVAFGWILCTLI